MARGFFPFGFPLLALLAALVAIGCQKDRMPNYVVVPMTENTDGGVTLYRPIEPPKTEAYEQFLRQRKLVPLAEVAPSVTVDLQYATRNNVTGMRLYRPSAQAWIDSETGKKLARAEMILRQNGMGIKVWDAYRPMAAQYDLWRAAPKADFVVDPRIWNSKHVSGRAVDVTLIRLSDGAELRMPSGFDNFTPQASANYQGGDPEIAKNIASLQSAMYQAGFGRINSEWWHFFDQNFADYNIPAFEKSL